MKKRLVSRLIEVLAELHPDLTQKERDEAAAGILIFLLISLTGLIGWIIFLVYLLIRQLKTL
ncbi:hypothetical protein [Spirosoma sp. KNUC1025]|uniref:hypothetical protein n=1 Tax=Spirosoma sp. KNUC1025 TaxID=2894082 RepID=UPI0038638A12|nr:hypothetical protein LN737_01305 [Spirosoma sp. KNUC1025]